MAMAVASMSAVRSIQVFMSISYRGCVTTSMSDGSPRFTTSSERRIAGPSSFGLVIGPCEWTPIPCADPCEVDIRIVDGRPDGRTRDAALVPIRHPLDVHDLLMVRAVVVHQGEQRDLVMRGRPPDTRRVEEVAVALNVHRDSALLLVGERTAHGGWRARSRRPRPRSRRCGDRTGRSPTDGTPSRCCCRSRTRGPSPRS